MKSQLLSDRAGEQIDSPGREEEGTSNRAMEDHSVTGQKTCSRPSKPASCEGKIQSLAEWTPEGLSASVAILHNVRGTAG